MERRKGSTQHLGPNIKVKLPGKAVTTPHPAGGKQKDIRRWVKKNA